MAIAGVVDKAYADAAERELIEGALAQGYQLTNTVHNMSERNNWTTAETVRYFKVEMRSKQYLTDWRAKWMQPVIQSLPAAVYHPAYDQTSMTHNNTVRPQPMPAKPYTIWNVPRNGNLTPLYKVQSQRSAASRSLARRMGDSFLKVIAWMAIIVSIFYGIVGLGAGNLLSGILFPVITIVVVEVLRLAIYGRKDKASRTTEIV